MNILIISQDYPTESKKYAMSYVHTRNEYYKNQINLDVLSFSTAENYSYNEINVLNLKSAVKNIEAGKYSILISHAPNVKNHVIFINKYKSLFKKIVLFIHGHEVLKLNKYYPEEYPFVKNKKKMLLQNIYDFTKLKVLKILIKKLIKEKKLYMIFVSEWMMQEALKNLGITEKEISNIHSIINNATNKIFIENRYKFDEENKLGDFITIRPLDQSKYGVDIVVEFAKQNPKNSFHIYGEGDYFKYNKKPNNVSVFNNFIQQQSIPNLLNQYKFALMPTRLDSQGVMNCEMATYGIPLVTSDIQICREMLSNFSNVYFISNDNLDSNWNFLNVVSIDTNPEINTEFGFENTVLKEIQLLQKII